MASDYFHPFLGGVESHIWALSQGLISMGHEVVVMTHMYDNFVGLREFSNGLRVHYLPLRPFHENNTLPTVFCALPLIRDVLIEENIEILHAHSAFSSLAHEAMLVARLLGLKVVFTDHSLFGFADASAVVTNKFFEISIAACNHCICVSHTGKENTVLRAKVKPVNVSVIPNAVDTTHFRPDPNKQWDANKITIVTMSRLVYRKGIDLIAEVIPKMCDKYPEVQFLVGGDGPGMLVLEEMLETHSLHNQVFLRGAMDAYGVRDTLTKGDIFLNTSLTEAFCMAIVEASACGSQVVSTRVGGIPEVLPPNLIILAEACVEDIITGLEKAIFRHKNRLQTAPSECHKQVRQAYSWERVVEKTSRVYEKVMAENVWTIKETLWRYHKTGVLAGRVFLLAVVAAYVLLNFMDWLRPRKTVVSGTLKSERILSRDEICLVPPGEMFPRLDSSR